MPAAPTVPFRPLPPVDSHGGCRLVPASRFASRCGTVARYGCPGDPCAPEECVTTVTGGVRRSTCSRNDLTSCASGRSVSARV